MFGLFSNKYPKVKVLGERNTGSRYLEWLLHKNVKISLLNDLQFGWKHRLIKSTDDFATKAQEVVFLVVVKNPYSWLLAMHRKPKHHPELENLSFSNFIRYSYGDYKNPIELFNLKYNAFLKLDNGNLQFESVRYEDLLNKPEDEIKRICEKYNFSKSFSWFSDTDKYVKNANETHSQRFQKSYYLKESWRSELKEADINYINEELDKALLDKFQYHRLG